MMTKPLVSVSVITYNQEKYLRECLDSIVSQETDFPFEVVVGDDCSTDSTRQICMEYKEKYPDIIRLRLPEKNMGSMPNWIANIEACEGKYIAFCEGDDYWTDNSKLRKQTALMERNPQYTICAHGAQRRLNDVEFYDVVLDRTELTIEDLISEDWGLMTASLFIRKEALHLPDWYARIKNGDYGLQLLLTLKGNVGYIADKMCVYRDHSEGISATLKPLNQAAWLTYLLNEFDKYTNKKYRSLLKKKVWRMYGKQIHFASYFQLRKVVVLLYAYRAVSPVAPFLIRHLRK